MASIEHCSHKFSWDGGGKEVFVCGSFNGWEKIPMAKRYTTSIMWKRMLV